MRDDYYEESDQVKRSKAKLEQAQVSQQQAEWRLEQATLKAPINGVVTTLFVESGEMANSGQTVITLSDLANLDVDVNLDETDVARIEMGMTVVVTVDAFPGMEVSGEVIEIASTADVQAGVVLYPIKVHLDPTDLPLRSGMTVNVMFTLEERKDTLVVPFRAVETEGGQAYLTRVTVSGSERVAVTMGLITDTQIEILSGIEEGDVITVYANPVQDTELMHNPMFSGGQ
jgi:RND family efflux transporter MFP subunit